MEPDLTFAVLPDRTGGARQGVFAAAIDALNLLRPDLVVQIGDLIEGYAGLRVGSASDEWDRIMPVLDRLEMPVVLVPGNHDINDGDTQDEWRRRHGASHGHLRWGDVLLVVLDTQDPPIDLEAELGMSLVEYLRLRAESGGSVVDEHLGDWDSTMRANVSPEQTDSVLTTLREHRDARWTFLFMHHPIWQGDGHPALDAIRRELGDRPYTMFAGHAHRYRHEVIDGRDHVRVGAAGGGWTGAGPGSFDHVTLVKVTAEGPVIANVLLDGVVDVTGRLVGSGALA